MSTSPPSAEPAPRPRLDRPFWAVFGLALVLDQVAIWATHWLPMGDVGGWIELMDVVARYDSADTVYRSVYLLPAGFEPNSLVVHLGAFLGQFMPSDMAAKVLIALYALGTPLAVLYMLRAFGRSRWLALFAAPMVFNALFNVGLLNYLIGFPLIFLGLGLARRFADDGRLRHGILLALTALGLFYAHALAFLIGVPMAAFVLVCGWRRRKDVLRLWPLVPALVPFAIWVFHKYVVGEKTEGGLALTGEHGLEIVFQTFDERLDQLHAWGMRFFRDNSDEWATLGLGLTWFVLVAVRPQSDAAASDTAVAGEPAPSRLARLQAVLHRYTLEIATLFSMLAYMALPSFMNEIQLIAERVVMQIALMLVAWPRHTFASWRQRALLLPVVVTALVYPIVVHKKFRAFERDYLGEVPAVLAALPDKSRLAYILGEREIDLTYMGPLWHIPKAIQAVENGGTTNDSFAIRPHCPVQFQPGQSPKPLPERFWRSPDLFAYDYVLVRAKTRPADALREPSLALRFEWSGWWLFEVLHDADGADTLVSVGGEGGQPFFANCAKKPKAGAAPAEAAPTRTALLGLAVTADASHVLALSPRCKGGRARGAEVFGEPAGKSSVDLRCRDDESLIGLHGRSGAAVDALGIVCRLNDVRQRAALGWPLGAAGVRKSELVGGPGGKPFDLRCPDARVATGLRGRAGASIDQAGLSCSPREP